MFSPYYYNNPMIKSIMSAINQLWWQHMPGVIFKVKWPTGHIVVDHNHPRWADMGGAVCVDLGFSSDPNDHYRPYLEQHIGRQGWDWDWKLADSDIAANYLTIKIRRSKAHYALQLGLLWS